MEFSDVGDVYMFYQVKTVVSGYLAVGSKRVTPYFLRSKDSTRLIEKVALQKSRLVYSSTTQ